jgi:hypothetical protein
MAKNIPMKELSLSRIFKWLLIFFGIIYAAAFVLSLLCFPQFREHIFHPYTLAMLIGALIHFLGYSLTKLFYLLIVYQLFRLLGVIKKGDPFNPKSPKRIRSIAYYTFGMAAIKAVTELESVLTIIANQGFPYPEFWPNLMSFLLVVSEIVFFGLGIFIIAIVLEAGVRLQQDQRLTV